VELKAMFIKNALLGGVLIHTLDMDDYTGLACHRGPFPIASIVSRVFSVPISSVGSPSSTTTTTTATTTTAELWPKKANPCAHVKGKDLVADENDCQYYFVCTSNQQGPSAHLKCPDNMQFSVTQKACTAEEGVRIFFPL
jgi:Chitin binding Peritrophin-A domain